MFWKSIGNLATGVALLMVGSFSIHGAQVGVVTTVSCTTKQSTVTDSSSCDLPTVYGGDLSASSSASYTASGNSLFLNLNSSATAPAGALYPANEDDSAHADASININLQTLGPMRSGFLIVTNPTGSGTAGGDFVDVGAAGASVDGAANASVSFGPLESACTSLSHVCLTENRLPILLGGNLSLIAQTDSDAFTLQNLVGANAFLNVELQLFEADGITPVNLTVPTPEPAMAILYSVGLLMILIARRLYAINFKGTSTGY